MIDTSQQHQVKIYICSRQQQYKYAQPKLCATLSSPLSADVIMTGLLLLVVLLFLALLFAVCACRTQHMCRLQTTLVLYILSIKALTGQGTNMQVE